MLLESKKCMNLINPQELILEKNQWRYKRDFLKKDSTKEKITVVIDGDNVTVNGKPVDDFVSDDVDINDIDFNAYQMGGVPFYANIRVKTDKHTYSHDIVYFDKLGIIFKCFDLSGLVNYNTDMI